MASLCTHVNIFLFAWVFLSNPEDESDIPRGSGFSSPEERRRLHAETLQQP